MKHLSVTAVIAAAMMFITDCGVQPDRQVGGGDDFPNILADAGSAINENMNQTWENPSVPEEDPTQVLDNATLPVESLSLEWAKGFARKKSESCDEVKISYNEDGTITMSHKRCKNTYTRYDTLILVVQGTDTLVQKASGTKEFTAGLIQRETYVCSDRDGDSILVNSNADLQQIDVFLERQFTDKLSKRFLFGVDPGESNDFSIENDNRIIDMVSLTLRDNDTLSSTVLTDADGNGFVAIPMTNEDSALVDIVMKTSLLDDTKLALKTSLALRMVVFNDENKNYCIRYTTVKHFTGYDLSWSASAADGDSSFYSGDTIILQRVIELSDNDSIQGDTLAVTLLSGDNPRDSTDEALLAIDVHKKLKKGEGREVLFNFTADNPIFPETTDRTGTVYYKTRFENDFEIEVNGSITEDQIVAEAATSEGKTYSVTWDRDGNVLSYSVTE